MSHLEQLFLRPKVEQLTRDWALKDPDLEKLRSGARRRRFEHFVDRLPRSKEESRQSSSRAYADTAHAAGPF